MEDQKKMSIADRFATAMFLPREYDGLLKLKTGKVISYLCILILLVTTIWYAIPVVAAIAGMGGIKNIAKNEIPKFSLENGEFQVEKKFEQENTGVYIKVDTDIDRFTKEDIPGDVVEAVLVSKHNMLLFNDVSGMGNMIQEETFDHYKSVHLSNEILADMSGGITLMLCVILAVIYVFVFAKYLFSALLFALVMYAFLKTTTLDIMFGKIYKTALFAKSFGAIVLAVVYCIDSDILILLGGAFNMLVTFIIMNKVFAYMAMEKKEELL